eukprot:762946-Hanusia_phi.AAC.1
MCSQSSIAGRGDSYFTPMQTHGLLQTMVGGSGDGTKDNRFKRETVARGSYLRVEKRMREVTLGGLGFMQKNQKEDNTTSTDQSQSLAPHGSLLSVA